MAGLPDGECRCGGSRSGHAETHGANRGCEIDRRRAGRGDAVQFCWRKRWGSNPQAIEGALFSRQAPSPSVGWLFRGGEGGSRSRIRSFERPCLADRWLCQFAHLAELQLRRDDELEHGRLRHRRPGSGAWIRTKISGFRARYPASWTTPERRIADRCCRRSSAMVCAAGPDPAASPVQAGCSSN